MNNKTEKPHQHQRPTTVQTHSNTTRQTEGTLWLTIEEAAAYARVSTRTIRNWRKKGLPVIQQNRKLIRIIAADIDRFLLRNYSTTTPGAVASQVDAILKDLTK